MPTYATPGVYIEEISTLPPTLTGVATAIPAFIGATLSHPGVTEGASTPVQVAAVHTMLEFEERFGRAPATEFSLDAQGRVTGMDPVPKHFLWYALQHYFRNGGARCYVLAVNNCDAALTKDDFERGLQRLADLDEPTLIVMPESVRLAKADFYGTCQLALAQCASLKDRFAILDVLQLPARRSEDAGEGEPGGGDASESAKDDIDVARDGYGGAHLDYGAAYYPYMRTAIPHAYDEASVKVGLTENEPVTLASLRTTNTDLYNRAKRNLSVQWAVLPPSAAIAGVYARVDRERGVWKSPANVGLAATIAPTVEISHERQGRMNIDATSGKSINAIRAFAGRGVLVWGARTLAGNDNEWRYVNVRRLFIMIEESTKKASEFATFEPNDANTWLKVKGMIESFLYGIWEQGALQGATPEAAYYVRVGLGTTMTSADIQEGRMIVEMGIAAVRPAEFIILRFSHLAAQA